jgi:hypothetical protein
MACGEMAFLEEILDRLIKFQEADRIGDSGAIFPGALGDLLLGEVEFLREALERAGLLDRIEIFALKVLNECHLERHFFGHIAHYNGNALNRGTLRGSPAALASDQLIAIVDSTNDERLDDSTRNDRAGELV